MPSPRPSLEEIIRRFPFRSISTTAYNLMSAIINPATERSIGEVARGGPADVEAAVIAAKQAFPEYAKTSLGQRIEWLTKIRDILV